MDYITRKDIKEHLILVVTFLMLYLMVSQSLKLYASRTIPLLAMAWLNVMFVRYLYQRGKLSVYARKWWFRVIWWVPVGLMVTFLVLTFVVRMDLWPAWLQVALPGMAFIALMVQGTFYALALLAPLIFMTLRKHYGKRFSLVKVEKFFLKTALTVSSALLLVLTLGAIRPAQFQVRYITVPVKNLPAALSGYRIVHISDMHLGTYLTTGPVDRAVGIINKLKPDAVLFTGDLVNYSSREAPPFIPSLKKLKAADGIYAVLGNHDYGDYLTWKDPRAKQAEMANQLAIYDRLHWRLLNNANFVINRGDARLSVTGVENWSRSKRYRTAGDMERATRNTIPGDVNILLTHNPDHWVDQVRTEYPIFDLVLSGHTHGMQLGLRAGNYEYSPLWINTEHVAGLYSKKQSGGRTQYLYVNRGLGNITYPGRVGILAEITLIRLVRE